MKQIPISGTIKVGNLTVSFSDPLAPRMRLNTKAMQAKSLKDMTREELEGHLRQIQGLAQEVQDELSRRG